MFRTRKRALGASVAAVLTTAVLVPAASTTALAATIVSDAVVINEVYGGGGNSGAPWSHDFVELVNTSDEPVSLDGWSVQYFSAAGNFGDRALLSGTIAPGSYYLVQGSPGSSRGAPALPAPDAAGNFAASATNGTFALVSNAETATLDRAADNGGDPDIVDLVGYGEATQYSGSAAAPKLNNRISASRTSNTGNNASDFASGTPTPLNSSAPPADPTDPTPTPTPTPTPEPTPDPTEPPAPGAPLTIAQIQGTGTTSPYAGQDVTTRGVVTAVYDEGGTSGFVIQTGGTGGALGTRAASEAIFVYGQDAAETVDRGNSVQVTGTVSEYFGLTQISAPVTGVTQLAEELAPVTPTAGVFPQANAQREALESMLFAPQGEWTVTDTYATNRFGEVGLVPGPEPLRQPGDFMAPGPEATALHNRQLRDVVLLDDGRNTNFTSSTGQQQPFSYISNDEPVRVGAEVGFAQPVIVTFGFEQWRFNLTQPWTDEATDGVAFENTRTAAPRDVGGDVTVGSFNVLNYFTTLGADTPGCTPYTNILGEGTNVRGGCLPRGAWDEESLARQTEKIVSAITALDASVLGLTEIENSARLGEEADEALAYLVAQLNAAAGHEKWAYVPTAEAMAAAGASAMDQDVITNAIIFQPAQVSLVEARIHADDPAFDNARDPIGAVFAPVGSAAGPGADSAAGEEFFYVVNHFKSKGSADAADANLPSDPVVGNSDTSRQRQARSLRDWVEVVQEDTDVEDVFLAGDFNAYTRERPLQVFEAAGYTNLGRTFEPGSWTYTFESRVGSLDHILANAGARERTTDATRWMINSPEAVSLQYGRYLNNVRNVHAPGPYASSDHDPVLAGVNANLPTGPVDPVDPVDPTPEPNVFLSNENTPDPDVRFRLPISGDVYSGDWDGDGTDTLAWRVGNEFTFASSNSAEASVSTMSFGRPTDQPVVGDWNGDGKDTIAVRRGISVLLRDDLEGGNATTTFDYGRPADVAVAGDFDGDTIDTVSVRRGNALLVRNVLAGGNAEDVVAYGRAQDEAISGDLDGDRGDELAVRRDDTFHLRYTLTAGNADLVVPLGQSSDAALIGDWDGDGIDTVGVARAAG